MVCTAVQKLAARPDWELEQAACGVMPLATTPSERIDP
jgi:hypothetical protein